MPVLPAPLGGTSLAGGDLPVSDGDDVLDEFSAVHKQPAAAPVRDDFCEAFAVSHLVYQDAAAHALAQTDPLRASGDHLIRIALERNVVPYSGESPRSLRARLFSPPAIVTPQAIVDAVNDLLAPVSDIECELVELELDGLYVHDGTVTTWDSFIGAQHRYPDRLYLEDVAENGGDYLENNNPGDITLISQGLPRNFHLRLPVLDAVDEDFAFAIDSDDEVLAISDGTDASGAESDGSVVTFVFGDGNTSEEIYAAIVGIVESIKAQGITWSALADSSLN